MERRGIYRIPLRKYRYASKSSSYTHRTFGDHSTARENARCILVFSESTKSDQKSGVDTARTNSMPSPCAPSRSTPFLDSNSSTESITGNCAAMSLAKESISFFCGCTPVDPHDFVLEPLETLGELTHRNLNSVRGLFSVNTSATTPKPSRMRSRAVPTRRVGSSPSVRKIHQSPRGTDQIAPSFVVSSPPYALNPVRHTPAL